MASDFSRRLVAIVARFRGANSMLKVETKWLSEVMRG